MAVMHRARPIVSCGCRRAARHASHPLLLGLLALATLLPGSARAATAKPIHSTFSGTTTGTLCGIPVTIAYSGVDNFTPVFDQAGNLISFRDTSQVTVTYTAANGKSVTTSSAGLATGSATTNPDGTITYVNTYKGLPEKITSASGTVLTRDAGLITIATTVSPDGTVTSTIPTVAGPHPEADSNFALFCSVITAALT